MPWIVYFLPTKAFPRRPSSFPSRYLAQSYGFFDLASNFLSVLLLGLIEAERLVSEELLAHSEDCSEERKTGQHRLITSPFS